MANSSAKPGLTPDPKIVEPALDQIKQRESRNQNVYSQLKGEDSSGYYQITKDTWNDFNQGYKQYAEAIDAPEAVQRDVARRIFAARGEQAWMGSNAAYKAAHGLAAGGGGGQTTAPATSAPATAPTAPTAPAAPPTAPTAPTAPAIATLGGLTTTPAMTGAGTAPGPILTPPPTPTQKNVPPIPAPVSPTTAPSTTAPAIRRTSPRPTNWRARFPTPNS